MSARIVLAAAVIVWAGFLASAAAQSADPFARSRDGAIECFTPDTVNHTCRAMSRYTFGSDRIGNEAIVQLQSHPQVVMYASAAAYARDGMICGRSDLNEVRTARFTIDGAAADAETTARLRQAVQQAMSALGREICSRYAPAGDGASVTAIIDGRERPELADRLIWIRPEDGYTIGGADASPT